MKARLVVRSASTQNRGSSAGDGAELHYPSYGRRAFDNVAQQALDAPSGWKLRVRFVLPGRIAIATTGLRVAQSCLKVAQTELW
jgi:hypothetical protein